MEQTRNIPLPPFPPPDLGSDACAISAAAATHGLTVRPLHEGDRPWLRELYASTRAEELAPIPWPDAAKATFLDQQFALQHRHYLHQFPRARFMGIMDGERPVGRYYLHCAERPWLVIDISLFPHWRARGVGSALLRATQAEAATADCALQLHVQHANPAARRLYERLAFTPVEDTGTHTRMQWVAN